MVTPNLKNDSAIQQTPLTFLSMLYISIMITSIVLGGKMIITHYGVVSAGSITCSLWFVLCDIITEIYGLKAAYKIFKFAMICELIFIMASTFVLYAPYPSWWHGQGSYDFVLGNLPRVYLSQLVATVIAWFLNTYLISQWKVWWRGGHFWFRSICSSGAGEAIFTLVSLTLIMWGRVSNNELYQMIILAGLWKLLTSTVCVIPATLIVFHLKKVEGLDVYDSNLNFKSFKQT